GGQDAQVATESRWKPQARPRAATVVSCDRQRRGRAPYLQQQPRRSETLHPDRSRATDAELKQPMTNVPRHKTRQVRVGHALIGGGAPVLVQSMTNTDTADPQSTATQVVELARAGSEPVRGTVHPAEAAAQDPTLRERLDA